MLYAVRLETSDRAMEASTQQQAMIAHNKSVSHEACYSCRPQAERHFDNFAITKGLTQTVLRLATGPPRWLQLNSTAVRLRPRRRSILAAILHRATGGAARWCRCS
jgi:hypothetical protein